MWRFITWMLVEAWPLCAFSSKNISCSFDLNCFGSKDMRSGMQPAYGNMKNSQRWEISRRSNWGDMRQIHGISLSLQALILDDTCRDATGALWAATQPLRCTSSFSNWRLYIWTYACLHISFAINFKMQRRASSYAWLLSYWSPYFWDGNHVRIGMSWWYCRIDPICYIILPCQFFRIQRLAILLKVGIIKIALKWHYFCRSTHHMGHTWGWMI